MPKRSSRSSRSRTRTRTAARTRAVASILAWDDDPGAPVAGDKRTPSARAVPDLTGTLAVSIKGRAPAPAQYAKGTRDFRFWAAADALARAAQFWSRIVGARTKWFTGASLPVTLDAGVDLNAYYDRAGLSFFHREVSGFTVYSGESPDVLCHELGHAVLDAIRPELWDTSTAETAAFHESFGDISAILSNLQLESVRRSVLHETMGRLYHSSRLSRLAEQLGWALRQLAPDATDKDCLRNAVNSFFYRDPDTLPPMAPASSLSSEPHSFSRVFTSAFFEGLAGMLAAGSTEAQLQQASIDAATLLIAAVRTSPIVADYYSQIAAHLISAATSDPARQAFRAAFVRHGVLSLEGALAVEAEAAAAMRRPRKMVPTPAEAALTRTPSVRHISMSGARYGLGRRAILVQAPADLKRYSVSSAAVDTGSVQAPSADAAARSYVEDLFRRGRVDVSGTPGLQNPVVHPLTRKTHRLVDDGMRLVLQRRLFDCGFDHCG
jgi:hypothetical protein